MFKVGDIVKYKKGAEGMFKIIELLDVEDMYGIIKPGATVINIEDNEEIYDDFLDCFILIK